jgi:hypothetical protein
MEGAGVVGISLAADWPVVLVSYGEQESHCPTARAMHCFEFSLKGAGGEYGR